MKCYSDIKHCYIHIPFCNNICTYCDFFRIKNNIDYQNKYVNYLIKTISNSNIKKNSFETIYLGGGTPNVLSYDNMEKLLKFLSNYKSLNCEFSIEINPELINNQYVILLKKYGINRVSIGAQSINNKILAKINRQHTFKDVLNAINLFKIHNINNISLDFIYNLENQTISEIKKTCKFLIKNNIQHVSFYALEVKDNSILKKIGYKTDEVKSEIFLLKIESLLKKYGYERYEVSNWCLNQQYSYHNLAYWKMSNWFGFGAGATGFINQTYYQIKSQDFIYNNWIYEYEKWDFEEYAKTKLMMNLRLQSGFDLNNKENMKIWYKYKNLIKNYSIINNRVVVNDLNLLNQSIEDLF